MPRLSRGFSSNVSGCLHRIGWFAAARMELRLAAKGRDGARSRGEKPPSSHVVRNNMPTGKTQSCRRQCVLERVAKQLQKLADSLASVGAASNVTRGAS